MMDTGCKNFSFDLGVSPKKASRNLRERLRSISRVNTSHQKGDFTHLSWSIMDIFGYFESYLHCPFLHLPGHIYILLYIYICLYLLNLFWDLKDLCTVPKGTLLNTRNMAFGFWSPRVCSKIVRDFEDQMDQNRKTLVAMDLGINKTYIAGYNQALG
jgi:hypothetical protein